VKSTATGWHLAAAHAAANNCDIGNAGGLFIASQTFGASTRGASDTATLASAL
jgi:hypothetical protein